VAAKTLVLLHSPLVGASTWQPVADVLRRRGRAVVVPSLVGGLAGTGPYYPRLVSAIADAAARRPNGGPAVLVGHSGAGALLPAAAKATAEAVAEATAESPTEAKAPSRPHTVFVDALLPHPGCSWFQTVPAALREQLRGLASGGLLPPWNEWFPPGTIEELLPDTAQRARFCAELPRVPLAYCEEAGPAADERDPGRSAYVQLSDAYADEAGQAEREGRVVTRRSAHHLAMLTDPEEIAALLEDAVASLPG
jgi:pimeloyl-ACP methyl ester carboxylesterase